MKRNFNLCLLAGAVAVFSLTACSDDQMDNNVQPQPEALSAKIDQPGDLEKNCSYVDNNWSNSSVLVTGLQNSTDTNFMNAQMTKIASLWGRSNPTLRFVNDPSNFNSTYNAISYSTGKIYY